MNIDPLAHQFASYTPYHFTHNNPINLIDPTGMSAENPEADQWKEDFFAKGDAYAGNGGARESVAQDRQDNNPELHKVNLNKPNTAGELMLYNLREVKKFYNEGEQNDGVLTSDLVAMYSIGGTMSATIPVKTKIVIIGGNEFELTIFNKGDHRLSRTGAHITREIDTNISKRKGRETYNGTNGGSVELSWGSIVIRKVVTHKELKSSNKEWLDAINQINQLKRFVYGVENNIKLNLADPYKK